MQSKQREYTITYLNPSLIVGWQDGDVFDVKVSGEHGLRYPKNQARYRHLSFDAPTVHIEKHEDEASLSMKLRTRDDACYAQEVLAGIRRRRSFDEPVVVCSLGERYLLLDGALRLSSVSIIRTLDLGFMPEVPAIVFDGTLDEAQSEMLSRHAEGRRRPLRFIELCKALDFLATTGQTEQRMAVAQGGAHLIGRVRKMIRFSKILTPEIEIEVQSKVEGGDESEDQILNYYLDTPDIASRPKPVPPTKTPVEWGIVRVNNCRERLEAAVLDSTPGDEAYRQLRNLGQSVNDFITHVRREDLRRNSESLK